MKDLFLVYRDWDKGEFDIFGLPTLADALEFCEFNPDYQLYVSTLYSLNEAKSIFERV
jgi:hypothetical protein